MLHFTHTQNATFYTHTQAGQGVIQDNGTGEHDAANPPEAAAAPAANMQPPSPSDLEQTLSADLQRWHNYVTLQLQPRDPAYSHSLNEEDSFSASEISPPLTSLDLSIQDVTEAAVTNATLHLFHTTSTASVPRPADPTGKSSSKHSFLGMQDSGPTPAFPLIAAAVQINEVSPRRHTQHHKNIPSSPHVSFKAYTPAILAVDNTAVLFKATKQSEQPPPLIGPLGKITILISNRQSIRDTSISRQTAACFRKHAVQITQDVLANLRGPSRITCYDYNSVTSQMP